MIINQPPERIKTIVGYNESTGEIKDLPISCLRKPLKPGQTIRSPYFAFVSNPNFANLNQYQPFMWLHCFKNLDWLTGKDENKYLFPESDFADECFIARAEVPIKYDYCYFTLNHIHSGVDYKGFYTFLNSLEVFHNLKLKGTVVVYFSASQKRWVFNINSHHKKLLNNVDVVWKKLDHEGVAKVMASSRFSFFPNHKDCSPRMVSESLIRNRPVLINDNIYGGWHYIEKDKNFGSLFIPGDNKSLEKAVSNVMLLPNNQSDSWKQYYGFESSTRKLASLVQKYCGDMGVSHLYFSDFRQVFKKWSKKRGKN